MMDLMIATILTKSGNTIDNCIDPNLVAATMTAMLTSLGYLVFDTACQNVVMEVTHYFMEAVKANEYTMTFRQLQELMDPAHYNLVLHMRRVYAAMHDPARYVTGTSYILNDDTFAMFFDITSGKIRAFWLINLMSKELPNFSALAGSRNSMLRIDFTEAFVNNFPTFRQGNNIFTTAWGLTYTHFIGS